MRSPAGQACAVPGRQRRRCTADAMKRCEATRTGLLPLVHLNLQKMTVTPLARSPRTSRGLRLAALSRLAALIFLGFVMWRSHQIVGRMVRAGRGAHSNSLANDARAARLQQRQALHEFATGIRCRHLARRRPPAARPAHGRRRRRPAATRAHTAAPSLPASCPWQTSATVPGRQGTLRASRSLWPSKASG